MEPVEACESGHGGVAGAEGEENLAGGVRPDPQLAKSRPSWVDVIVDPLDDDNMRILSWCAPCELPQAWQPSPGG